MNRHKVVDAKRLGASRTFPRPITDAILHADVAENMAAQLEHRVAQIRVANRADGDFLRFIVSRPLLFRSMTMGITHPPFIRTAGVTP